MRISLFAGTALSASAFLVFGRPQLAQNLPFPIGDLTRDFSPDPDAYSSLSNFGVPAASELMFSPSRDRSTLSNDDTKLAFVALESPGVVPQNVADTNVLFGSTEASADYTKTAILPSENSLFVAAQANGQHPFQLLTDEVRSSVGSIVDRQNVWGIFGISDDGSKLVRSWLSKNKDWATFAWTVRKARPCFALRSLENKILIIFYHLSLMDTSSKQKDYLLDDHYKSFYMFVQSATEKLVEAEDVDDESSLENIINSVSVEDKAPSVYFDQEAPEASP